MTYLSTIKTILLVLSLALVFWVGSSVFPQNQAYGCTVSVVNQSTNPSSFLSDTSLTRYQQIRSGGQGVSLTAVVKWENCGPETYQVALEDVRPVSDDRLDDSPYSVLIPAEPTTLVQFKWILGDDECGNPLVANDDYCRVRLDIDTNASGRSAIPGPTIPIYNCYSKDTELSAEDCDEPFSPVAAFFVEEDTSGGTTVYKKLPFDLPTDPNLTQSLAQIQSSPCYDDTTKKVAPNCIGLLSPLPGLSSVRVEADNTAPLGNWINLMLRILIGFAGLLAVVMIIIAGVQYMSSDLVTSKGGAKNKIQDALIGLLLALGIFIILNTINPNLTITSPGIGSVSYKPSNDFELKEHSYTPTAAELAAGCPDCETIDSSISIKSGAGNQISAGYHNKLKALQQILPSGNPGWVITEAFSPTRTHKHPCHYNGTCIDVGLRPNTPPPSLQQVEAFITAARQVGLHPKYEIDSAAREQVLEPLRAKFGNGVLSFPKKPDGTPWISGEHFSVYQ